MSSATQFRRVTAILLAVHVLGCASEESSGQLMDSTIDMESSLDAGAAVDGTTETDQDLQRDQSLIDEGVMLDVAAEAIDMAIEERSDGTVTNAPMTVSNVLEECETVGLIAPNIPSESGHYAATVLTPSAYPFAIEAIQYSLLKNDDVPTCDGSLGHRVILFAIDSEGPLPEVPSATGLGYRSYDVPSAAESVAGRQIEIAVPIPLILTEGQRAVVAIQFASQGGQHICVANCLSDAPLQGIDWWSNAAETPFRWQDLVAELGLTSQLMTRIVGSTIR